MTPDRRMVRRGIADLTAGRIAAVALAAILAAVLAACGARTVSGDNQDPDAVPPIGDKSGVPDPAGNSTAPGPPKSERWIIDTSNGKPVHGVFSPTLELTPKNCGNPAGKTCQLAQDFTFTRTAGSGNNRVWQASRWSTTDGQSVPDFALGLLNIKRLDPDRLASAVIHDHYCIRRVHPSLLTHQVYHEMLLAQGERPDRALIMYAGVLIGGPKWTTLDKPYPCKGAANCIRNTKSGVKFEVVSTGEFAGRQVERLSVAGDADYREGFMEIARRITDNELTGLRDVQSAAAARFPNDPFLSLGISRSRSVSLEALENFAVEF
jgi:hypothetical protein